MTTTVATRRSVLSGLAVSALALAAMASFVLISVSGGAGAQTLADGLDDTADPPCTDDCTTAEIVLYSPYSGLHTADPEDGFDFSDDDLEYGTGQNSTDPILALSTPGFTVSGPTTRDIDLSEATGRVYTTVVDEIDDDSLTDAQRVQNAIVEGSDIFGIAVYDPDAAIPQTITLSTTQVMDINSNIPSNVVASTAYSLNIDPDHEIDINGVMTPVLPIRGDIRFFNGMVDITGDVVMGSFAAGDPVNNRRAFLSFTPLVRTPEGLRIEWTTASDDNFVVVEVDGNATSSAERLYLRLKETVRGSDLYVGEVQLFSAGTEDNRDAYRNFVSQGGTRTPTATTLFTGVPRDGGGDLFVVGQPRRIVRAPFIADARDNITVRFRDKTGVTGDDDTAVTSNRSASVTVETDAPTITVTTPEHNLATSDREISFTGTASDADSGLDVGELRLGIANPQDPVDLDAPEIMTPAPVYDLSLRRGGSDSNYIEDSGHIGSLMGAMVNNDRVRVLVGTENEDNGLYRDGTEYEDGVNVVDWRYTPDTFAEKITDDGRLNHMVTFSLIAVDLAGNVGFSDSDDGETGLDNNFRDDFQPHVITLDGLSPELRDEDKLSFTGVTRYENTDVVVYGTSQTGILWDANENDLVVARNAIAVAFDGTVEPPSLSDFTIEWDGDFSAALQRVVPSPNLDLTDLDGVLGGAPAASRDNVARHVVNTVFLVFDQNIPSSQTPRIRVSSNVTDPAGNRIASNANVVAEDGLGPGVTVTLSGGSGVGSDADGEGPGTLTNDEILVEIQVNEEGPNPTVSFYPVDVNERAFVENRRSRPSGTNNWQFLFQRRIAGANEGIVCVVVSVEDNPGNATTAGTRGEAGEPCNQNSSAVFFTLDATPPDLRPRMGQTVYEHPPVFDTRPIIQIPLDEAVDTSQEVNLRINDEDIETTDATLRTSDNQVFVYQPPVGSELDFDTHQVEFRATDLAGNTSPFRSFNIRISERSDFELALSSGWNLISFPSDPINPRVSAVFNNPNVQVVSTFDAANFRAGNQMATRNPVTGSFSGNLSEISTGLAYWVFSEAFTNLDVRLQGPQAGTAGQIPTAITIPTVGGVNLVGVVDPSLRNTQNEAGGTIERGGSSVTVDEYLDNVSQSRVQVYDSTNGTFVDVAGSAMVRTGMGLVVYINPDITGRTPEIIP